MEKTIEIKAIDKEKALKRALNILGVELTENEAVEIVEKVKPRKKFFGLFGTEPGIYEVSVKTKEKEAKTSDIQTIKNEKVIAIAAIVSGIPIGAAKMQRTAIKKVLEILFSQK